jgi:maltooligosyltrehalose trehalohydrolase
MTAVLLSAPEIALLFMGQEWAATTPFCYFTDHTPELGRQVTDGRRREFSRFEQFRDAHALARIPDPQAPATFEMSKLIWAETDRGAHAATLAFHRALLDLRRSEKPFSSPAGADVAAPDAVTIVIRRRAESGESIVAIARVRGGGTVDLTCWIDPSTASRWSVILTSEDAAFRPPDDGHLAARPSLDLSNGAVVMSFARPGAAILKGHE